MTGTRRTGMSLDTAPPPAHVPPSPWPAHGWKSWQAWVVPGAGAAALVLWALSLSSVRVEETDGWGLLTALPVLWYVAFAVAVLGCLGALIGRRAVLHTTAAPLAALVALLFGTTSAVYDAPRYPWTYKHVGVTEYVLENWSIDRSVDIYHNFPGFFFLTAALSKATGIEPLTLAQWTQPVLAVITAAAVYWAVGGVTSSRRIRYGAVLVHLLGDWIGQNYFAPQGLAFPVALFVLGGLLRSVPAGREGLRWERLRIRFALADDGDLPRGHAFWGGRRGTLLLVAAFAFVAVSHPLSPVILLGQAVLLCLLLRPARPWLLVAFFAIELFWLVLAWPFLTSTYDLFEFGVRNVEPPQLALVEPLPGYEMALWAAPLLMAVIALLTVYSVLRGLRRPGRVARLVAPVAMAAVPVVMVLGQPYGNEGIFRAYLFALPWLAYLIASRLFADGRRWTAPRLLGTALPIALVAVLTLPANFAAEMRYRVAASDVAAAVWFGENAPPGSVLLPFTAAYPSRSTAEYADHLPDPTEGVLSLTELSDFEAAAEDQTDLVEFTEEACATRAGDGPVFVAIGPSAADDVRLLGRMRLYTYRAFERAIAADPDFTEVFREGDSALFRCRD
jgi:hypothetical protein